MPARRARPAVRLALTAPIVFLILAATAIPIQFRPVHDAAISTSWDDVPDILANILLYVPLGLVLSAGGAVRAALLGAVLSAAAETGQIVMLHRDPSLVDVITNVAGTALGALLLGRRSGWSRTLGIGRPLAAAAALLAIAPFGYMWSESGLPVNPRGVSEPGTLEASWDLGESSGRAVADLSGHDLAGRFRRQPPRVDTARGPAAVLTNANSVTFGRSTALRLEGSMTITAWIESRSYPDDDAAIVSARRELGFQLDTTADGGPRTLGFKLSNACGELAARYGATPLALGTWYHVAGVYDASSRTMHVYVDGRLDDGPQVGTVSRGQRSSRGAVYAGRRAGEKGFEFSGAMDHLRIYSFALTAGQVLADMQGTDVGPPTVGPMARSPAVERGRCGVVTDREDKDLPFAAGVAGMLVAVAVAALWPARAWLLAPALGLAAGSGLLVASGSTLPAFNLWTIPLTALAAGVVIAASMRPLDQTVLPGPASKAPPTLPRP